jgi:hypothetical protein
MFTRNIEKSIRIDFILSNYSHIGFIDYPHERIIKNNFSPPKIK